MFRFSLMVISLFVLLSYLKSNSTMTTPHQFTKEELQEEFRAGVTATLRSWSAFRTAVDSGWGGGQSLEKAENLRLSINEHLNGNHYPPKMDMSDLEDNLAIYMEEEFSITLEDNSERQVAETLFRMYEDCFGKGDPTLCRQIVASATLAAEQISTYPVQIQDDEDDDMEDVGDEETTQLGGAPSVAQSYASESLFGGPIQPKAPPQEPARQLGEAPPTKMEPELDDDGFAAIATKKKKKPSAMM